MTPTPPPTVFTMARRATNKRDALVTVLAAALLRGFTVYPNGERPLDLPADAPTMAVTGDDAAEVIAEAAAFAVRFRKGARRG